MFVYRNTFEQISDYTLTLKTHVGNGKVVQSNVYVINMNRIYVQPITLFPILCIELPYLLVYLLNFPQAVIFSNKCLVYVANLKPSEAYSSVTNLAQYSGLLKKPR